MLIGMEGPGDCLICRQMIRGWDAQGASSRRGDMDGWGLEVKAVLVVKDNPTPATCNQEGGEGECKAPWTHFTGGWASGRWLLPVPGSSQVWPRLPCGPSLCLPLPGLVFCLMAQQLSSAVLEPSFLPQDVCFFFYVTYF